MSAGLRRLGSSELYVHPHKTPLCLPSSSTVSRNVDIRGPGRTSLLLHRMDLSLRIVHEKLRIFCRFWLAYCQKFYREKCVDSLEQGVLVPKGGDVGVTNISVVCRRLECSDRRIYHRLRACCLGWPCQSWNRRGIRTNCGIRNTLNGRWTSAVRCCFCPSRLGASSHACQHRNCARRI